MTGNNRVLRTPSAPRDLQGRCKALADAHGTPGRLRGLDAEELIDLAGLAVTLRPLRAEDGALHDEFLARVDARDIRFRFGREIGELPRSELARMTEIDGEVEIALVATTLRDEGGWEILGEVRARADPDPYSSRSEFAIVVRSDFQRLGLGRALLEKLIAHCRTRKVQLLYGLVDPANLGMLGLARRLGFDIDHIPRGSTAVVSLILQQTTTATNATSNRERTAASAIRAL